MEKLGCTRKCSHAPCKLRDRSACSAQCANLAYQNRALAGLSLHHSTPNLRLPRSVPRTESVAAPEQYKATAYADGKVVKVISGVLVEHYGNLSPSLCTGPT